MSDIKINDIPLLTGALKGDATTVVVQNLDTRRITIQSLSAIIANAVPSDTPVGQVSFFATTVPPNGWIECKGTKLNIVGEFNELYKVIGHTFTDILNPSVDKTKYFYAPDLRGYFIRALNGDATVDEDVGRKLGSIQEDSIEKHRHEIINTGGSGTLQVDIIDDGGTGTKDIAYTEYVGGVETRPKNVALMACIKYSAAKGPATPVTPTNPTTNSGIDISTNSGNVGSFTGLKFTGNVDVTKTGDVATINVKSSGSGGRPNVLGFPVFKDSYWTRCVITDEPSLIGWGKHATGEHNDWKNMDPSGGVINPPRRYRFDDFYLIDNPNLKIVKAISSVYFQSVLLSDGTLWVNGYDYADGRTGLGIKNNKPTVGFMKVNTSIKFSDFDISVDNNTGNISFAAIETGTKKLYTWGLNAYGQLGQGSTTVVNKPTLVSDNSTKAVRQIVFSAYNDGSKLLVLYDDNTLYACGYNNYGQLGVGNTTNQTKLTQCKKNSTTLVSDAKRIVGSGWGTFNNSGYISTSDEFYACGYNGVGNIGDGTKVNSSFFIKSNISEKVKDVVTSSGFNYGTNYLALGMSGKMYSWGRNAYGQLGHGDTTEITSPKLIRPMSSIPIQKIFGYDGWGDARAFGCLDSNGRVYMTGYNIPEPPDFSLGQKTTLYTRMNVPDKVVDMVLLGGENDDGNFQAALFLTQSGKVFSFGKNGDIDSTDSSFPVEIRI